MGQGLPVSGCDLLQVAPKGTSNAACFGESRVWVGGFGWVCPG